MATSLLNKRQAYIIDAYIDGLVQERCNASALAMELHLFCNNASICLFPRQAKLLRTVHTLFTQSHECTSANGVILKDMGNIKPDLYLTTTKPTAWA